jgi:hypothetical protein
MNNTHNKFKFKMLIVVVVTLLFSMTISQSIPLSFGLSSNVSLYALDDCKSGATESFRYHTNAEYNSIFYTQGYNWNHVSCNNSGSNTSSTQSSNTDTGTYSSSNSNTGTNNGLNWESLCNQYHDLMNLF